MRNVFLLIFLLSCGYKTTELPDGITERTIGTGQSGVNFATVSAQIFGPSCVRCHGSAGGVNLSTYAGARAALNRIAGAVNSGAMPPGAPLSQALKDLLNSWITAGGPESSGNAPTGGTAGTPQLDFATMRARIFQPSCVGCHGSSGGVNVLTYANVRRSLSRIRSAVNSGEMPPSGPLPQAERNLLNLWIDAGAPEIAGTTSGGAAGGTGGGGNDDNDDDDDKNCEDDDRLLGPGLVVNIGQNWVYDRETETMRRKNNGCFDNR